MASRKLFDEDFLRRLQRLGLIAKRIPTSSSAAGQRRSRRLGDGLEFADHRAYAPGDDIRFLDWPYFARMERLLLRLFHEHSEGVVTILLDCSGSMRLGEVCKFDYARRTAAALAYVAMAGLDRVRILPFAAGLGDDLRTGRDRGRIMEVLEFLESLNPDGKTMLGLSVEQYVRRQDQAATVIILTDMLEVDDDLPGALAVLRQHRDDCVLLHVVDRHDASPPILGPTQLGSPETTRRVNLNITEPVLAAYAERWREFVRDLEKASLAKGVLYIQAPTNAQFERLVLQTLRKIGVLQV